MTDKLKVGVWGGIRRWYGQVSELSDDPDVNTGGPAYKVVYETEGDGYGEVIVNIALSLIRNSTEEIPKR
jgi:hypothetical protein